MKKVVVLTGGSCTGKTSIYKEIVKAYQDRRWLGAAVPKFYALTVDWLKNNAERKNVLKPVLTNDYNSLFIEGTMSIRPVFELAREFGDIDLTLVFVDQPKELAEKRMAARRQKSIDRKVFGGRFSSKVLPHRINAAMGLKERKTLEQCKDLYPYKILEFSSTEDFSEQKAIIDVLLRELGMASNSS